MNIKKILILSGFLMLPCASFAEVFNDELDSPVPILLSIGSTDNASIEVSDSKITMYNSSVDGEETSAYLNILGATDNVEIVASIDSSSDFSGTDKGRVFLYSSLFNDTADGGHDGFDGDMIAGIQLRRYPDGYTSNLYCLWRRDADGTWQSAEFFSGNTCWGLDTVISEDTQHEVAISVDRTAGTLSFRIDDTQDVYPIAGVQNKPFDSQTSINTRFDSMIGQMSSQIYSIKTDVLDTNNYGGFAGVGRYNVKWEDYNSGKVQWSDSELTLTSSTQANLNDEVRVRLPEFVDILTADILVSSDSIVDADFPSQRFGGTVSGFFYNDLSDNGGGQAVGDVFASTELAPEADGGISAYYCILRSDAADYSAWSYPMDGEVCKKFATVPEYGTFYTLSVGLNKAANSLVFSFDGETVEYEIQTPVYLAWSNFRAVRSIAFSEGSAGTAVVKVDRIATDEFISQCNNLDVTVYLSLGQTPTSGDDVILGTPGNDNIVAMGGNDTICALGGNDSISGGRGNDWIDAGPGDDVVDGGNNDDTVYGDAGIDTLNGGPGDDEIYGEGDGDFIKGNSGNDVLDGGDGIDQLIGGSGNDTISTGGGGNRGTGLYVDGGAGNDVITGGDDNDEIRGATGNDIINGYGGDDALYGGGGNDIVNGQEGNDLIRGNGSKDTLNGGNGDDDIDGGDGIDIIYGGNDNDTIRGSTGNDTIYGGAGEDNIKGGGGNDTIYGNRGDDMLFGGGSNDSLNGGSGTDSCDGQTGTDSASSCETVSNLP